MVWITNARYIMKLFVTGKMRHVHYSNMLALHTSVVYIAHVGIQMLVFRFWFSHVGTQMLVLKCWYSNVGAQMLVLKCWYSTVGILLPSFIPIQSFHIVSHVRLNHNTCLLYLYGVFPCTSRLNGSIKIPEVLPKWQKWIKCILPPSPHHSVRTGYSLRRLQLRYPIEHVSSFILGAKWEIDGRAVPRANEDI